MRSTIGRSGKRSAGLPWLGAIITALALALALVPGAKAQSELGLSVVGSGPGSVTVEGSGGDGGVWLFQCADAPESEEMFWRVCDNSTGLQVLDDAPWSVQFVAQAVVRTGEPFPPRTENAIGNGTTDCQAAGAHCVIAGTSDWQSFAWSEIPFTTLYGPLGKAVVDGQTTELVDGQAVSVASAGHRPDTQAMTYICPRWNFAFPGACDPIPSSEATISAAGEYARLAAMPRFVWVDDPFGNGSWYDCADGCSVLVASAENLTTEPWQDGVDPMLTFRAESLVKRPQVLTVTRVRVNRMGGITVEGRVDCTQAVAEWGQSGSVARVNIDWTARQPVGRRSAVTAHYDSAIATICHDPANTNPLLPPYPWYTHPPITDPSIWWVYPANGGKFAAGQIHLDVQATGGSWSSSPGADQYLLSGMIQWDGKAVKG